MSALSPVKPSLWDPGLFVTSTQPNEPCWAQPVLTYCTWNALSHSFNETSFSYQLFSLDFESHTTTLPSSYMDDLQICLKVQYDVHDGDLFPCTICERQNRREAGCENQSLQSVSYGILICLLFSWSIWRRHSIIYLSFSHSPHCYWLLDTLKGSSPILHARNQNKYIIKCIFSDMKHPPRAVNSK